MPLKLAVQDIQDVPEHLHQAYRPSASGRGFVLDMEYDVVPKTVYDETRRQLETVVIDQEIARAAVETGAQSAAIDDIAHRIRGRFKLGDDGRPYATDHQGNRIYGEDGQPLSVNGAVRQLTSVAPHLFRPASERRGTGTGHSAAGHGAGNPWAKDTWNVTAQMRIMRTDHDEAVRLASIAGHQI